MILIPKNARILAIGAHPDDIELGAGGFVYRLVHEFHATLTFLILTDGRQAPEHGVQYPEGRRVEEAREAARLLGVKAGAADSSIHVEFASGFEDCRLDKNGHELIKAIESVLYGEERMRTAGKRLPRFDIILSHAGEDTHADHRALHESTLSAARDFHGTLLFYQAPSTKPNGFRPTFFVKLDDDAIEKKRQSIQVHLSQHNKVFTDDRRTAGLAGSWSRFLRLPEGTYLEAFEVYKIFV